MPGQIVDSIGRNLVLRHEDDVTSAAGPSASRAGQGSWGVGDNVTVTGWLDERFMRTGSLNILGVYVADRRAFFALGEEGGGDGAGLRPSVVPPPLSGARGAHP